MVIYMTDETLYSVQCFFLVHPATNSGEVDEENATSGVVGACDDNASAISGPEDHLLDIADAQIAESAFEQHVVTDVRQSDCIFAEEKSPELGVSIEDTLNHSIVLSKSGEVLSDTNIGFCGKIQRFVREGDSAEYGSFVLEGNARHGGSAVV